MKRAHLAGKLVVQLKPGLELERIAAHRDVRLASAQEATRLDGGPVERVVKRFSPDLRASRAYSSRQNVATPGKRHLDWDDLEHELGFSRTLRLTVHPLTDVRALAAELAALDAVQMVSPQYLCRTPFAQARPEPLEDAGREDEARALVGASEALALEPGDETIIVGLVDSGAEPRHPELDGRLRPSLSTVSVQELAGGPRLLSGPRARQDSSDDEGHGTACAGIVGAAGLAVPRGLAGAAALLPVRSLCGARMPGEDHATAVGSLCDIDSGWKSAVDLGARVLNLSFGTPQSSLDLDDPVPHVQVARYSLARECVLVSAAGNSGVDERYFPAALPGVIAVGSVGTDRRRSSFSTGGQHVALCAPGEKLRVATLGGGYARLSGTSFASPLVAAAAALIIARGLRQSTALSAAAVRDILRRSCSPFAPGDSRTTHATCGAGVLDVPAALRATDEECQADAA